jgi:hypothetical protein
MPSSVDGKTKTCARVSCKLAGQPQPINNFALDKGRPDGRCPRCRVCESGRNKSIHNERLARGVRVTRAKSNADPKQRTAEELQIARLKMDLTRAQGSLREMEKLALSGEALRELIGTLGVAHIRSNPDWLRGANKQSSVHGTAVLTLSDIHLDERVARAQVGGVNEYNRAIGVKSIQNTFRNTIRLLKSFMARPKYDGIVVNLGGDMVSGNIHDELVETNEAPIQQTMLVLEEVLIEGLGGLADEFGKVHVPCVTGNHGRMHKKPRMKNRAFENFEWSVYQRVASYFRRDSRLTFDIPEGSDAYYSIYNMRVCLTHGDQFNGGNGIGGIMVPILRGVAHKLQRQQAIGDPFDLIIMGHWHQYIHTNRVVINGSVKGLDEYAYQHNFGFEPPQQALFVVHPEVGCTFRMPVLCRKAA